MNPKQILNRKTLVGASLALAAATAGVLVSGLSDSERRSGLNRGDRFRYALELATDVQATGAAVLSRLRLEGEWELMVLDGPGAGGRVQFAARLRTRSLDLGQSSIAASEAGEVRDGLATPMYFTTDGRGAVVEVRPDQKLPAVAETIGRSLISYTQVLLDGGDRWSREELDQTGPYLAEYTRQGGRQLAKRKLRYVGSGRPGKAELKVLASAQQIGLTPSDGLASLNLEETIEATLGTQLKVTSTTRLHVSLQDRGRDLAAAVAALGQAANRVALRVDAPPASRDVYRRWDRQRAEGQTVDGLLQQLLPAKRAGQNDEANDLFGRLAAVLRVNEAAVTEVGARIAGGDPEWKLLVDGLAAAGTPPAQAALRQMIESPPTPGVHRGAVLLSLSLVREPTAESVATLQGLIDDAEVGSQAKLGLGSYASALSEQQPERARKLVSTLTQALERSTGQATLDYLTALGNAGMREAIPTVERYLSSATPAIREHAVRGLRRAPGRDVDGQIVERMRKDGNAQVRTSAALAIRDRDVSPQLAAALDQAARTEPDLVTRFTALKTIIEQLDRAPQLRQTLAWAAVNDPNPELREALKGYRAR